MFFVHVFFFFSNVDAIYNYETHVCNNTISDYKTLCTGGIFATYPKDFLTLGTGFFDQVQLSLINFCICILYNDEVCLRMGGMHLESFWWEREQGWGREGKPPEGPNEALDNST